MLSDLAAPYKVLKPSLHRVKGWPDLARDSSNVFFGNTQDICAMHVSPIDSEDTLGWTVSTAL